MFKKIQIILVLCLAIFFKISFFNIASFILNKSFLVELITTQQVFKVGKQRRRKIVSFSKAGESLTDNTIASAENEEKEDSNKLFNRFRLPIISLFTGFISSIEQLALQIQISISGILDACSYSLSSKKYLDISILRI